MGSLKYHRDIHLTYSGLRSILPFYFKAIILRVLLSLSLLLLTLKSFASQQLAIVQVRASSFQGQLQRFERSDQYAKWQPVGRSIPVVVGKNGIALTNKKREGDGKTPSGAFPIQMLFGFAKQASFKLNYRALTKTTICVDDPGSRYYDQIINLSQVKKPDWQSAEVMRKISLYKWGGVIQYNPKHLAYVGSCLFLHAWRNDHRGTEGCIAMRESDLLQLLAWLDPRKKPMIDIRLSS